MQIIYAVYPIPGEGCELSVASDDPELTFSKTRLYQNPRTDEEGRVQARLRSFSVSVSEAAVDPKPLQAIFREGIGTVREAMGGCNGFDVLDRLQPIREAAQRQVNRYVAWKDKRADERASVLEISELEGIDLDRDLLDETHPRVPDGYHDGVCRAVALLAGCDWVECFFLETGRVPTAKEADDATGRKPRKTEDDLRRVFTAVVAVLDADTELTAMNDVCERAMATAGRAMVLPATLAKELRDDTLPLLQKRYPDLNLPENGRVPVWRACLPDLKKAAKQWEADV